MSFAFPSTAGASTQAASVEAAASKPTKTIVVEIGENEKGPGLVFGSGVVTTVLQGSAGARAGIVTGMRLVSVAGQAVAPGGTNAKGLLKAQCLPKTRVEVEVEEANEEVVQATPAAPKTSTTATTAATTTATIGSTGSWGLAASSSGLNVSSGGFGFSNISTQPAPATTATATKTAWAAPQPPSMPVTAAPAASAVLAESVPSLHATIAREDSPADSKGEVGDAPAPAPVPAPAAAAAADDSDIASLSPSSLAGSSCSDSDSSSDSDGGDDGEQTLCAYIFDCETTRRRAEAAASDRARLIEDNAACLRRIRTHLEADTPYARPAAPLRVRRRRATAATNSGEAAAAAAAAALAAQATQASPAACLAALRSLSSDADSLRDEAAAAAAAAERGLAEALTSAEEAAAEVAEEVDAAAADVFEAPLDEVAAPTLAEAEEVLCGVAERTGDEGLARLGRCRQGAAADGDGGRRRERLVEELQAAAGDAGAAVGAGERAGRQLRKALGQQDAVTRLLAEERRLRAIHGLAEAMCVPEVGKTPALFKTVFGDTGLAKLEENSLL